MGCLPDGWQHIHWLHACPTSKGSNSWWTEERSHSMQSWLFWKNNRDGAVPVLMSISGLLNPVCVPLILAGHSLLQHILNASSVMLIYAIEWLCVPHTLSKPKLWPWPEAKLTWTPFKTTMMKRDFFLFRKIPVMLLLLFTWDLMESFIII